MKKQISRYCCFAVLFVAVFSLASCEDEEERELYGGPWRIVKTPPEVWAPIRDLFFLDANHGWATSHWHLMRWNGKEWTIQKKFEHPGHPDAAYALRPIWVFDENDIIIAGCEVLPENERHSKIWHYDGEYWEEVDHPDVGGIGRLWFNSPDDGWAMGGDYMLRWDGKEWYQTEWPGYITTSVWFNGPNDGWRTSFSSIYHWNGVTWTKVAECDPFNEFTAIAFNRPDSGWAGLSEGWGGGAPPFFTKPWVGMGRVP
ncbi:MAG: hypothetical protein PVH29_14920, partial [Candidatus Zixiibacteriota bacterium]